MKTIEIAKVNSLIEKNPTKLIDKEEKRLGKEIFKIAKLIKKQKKKILLISGPSSSGKTTSSFLLRESLKKLNLNSTVINLDDFYYNRDEIPLREDGLPDLESFDALDKTKILNCLSSILLNKDTKVPQFDFVNGKRKKQERKILGSGSDIIIVEGLHALNPQITEGLDSSKIFKLYLNCETTFSTCRGVLDGDNLRLLRRIIRDERDRGRNFETTLLDWKEVCLGEEKNIKPFKKDANYILDTTFIYEPLLYKDLIFVKTPKECNDKMENILKVLTHAHSIDKSIVPENSLLREFIGKEN